MATKKGTKKAPLIFTAQDLPPCPGPKLGPFPFRESPIEWLERLDEDRTDESGTQGAVFKVLIASKYYAVKVFKFYNPSSMREHLGPIRGPKLPEDLLTFHTDPFFAECRAYGKIQEDQLKTGRKHPLACPCYGYMGLKEKDERILEERGVEFWNNDPDDPYYQEQRPKSPVRAIVKELLEGTSGVNQKSLHRILQAIKALQRLKVYNMDIRVENYKQGLLVDFGSSYTEPNCVLDILPKHKANSWRLVDRGSYEAMVRGEGLILKRLALPDPKYHSNDRSRSKRKI